MTIFGIYWELWVLKAGSTAIFLPKVKGTSHAFYMNNFIQVFRVVTVPFLFFELLESICHWYGQC